MVIKVFNEFQSMEEDVGCDEVKAQSSNQIDNHEEAQDKEETVESELMQADQEEETKDYPQLSQNQSTSSITLKLNKLNCDSSSSEDPKPGPSNSAADFDLEVNHLFNFIKKLLTDWKYLLRYLTLGQVAPMKNVGTLTRREVK